MGYVLTFLSVVAMLFAIHAGSTLWHRRRWRKWAEHRGLECQQYSGKELFVHNSFAKIHGTYEGIALKLHASYKDFLLELDSQGGIPVELELESRGYDDPKGLLLGDGEFEEGYQLQGPREAALAAFSHAARSYWLQDLKAEQFNRLHFRIANGILQSTTPGEPDEAYMYALLADPDLLLKPHLAAVQALCVDPQDFPQSLLVHAKSEYEKLGVRKSNARSLLKHYPDTKAAAALVEYLLHSPEDELRWIGLKALPEGPQQDALRDWALDEERSTALRLKALKELEGLLPIQELLDAIAACMDSKDKKVAKSAKKAFKRLKSQREHAMAGRMSVVEEAEAGGLSVVDEGQLSLVEPKE